MKTLLSLIMLIALTGCKWQSTYPTPSTISPKNLLSETQRAELHLPINGVLTLANESDVLFARNIDRKVATAIEKFLKSNETQFNISAARPVGDYLLLWIGYTEIMDGGIDIIFSVEKMEVVGFFCGGYRG